MNVSTAEVCRLLDDANATILRLEAENKVLRAALAPVAWQLRNLPPYVYLMPTEAAAVLATSP